MVTFTFVFSSLMAGLLGAAMIKFLHSGEIEWPEDWPSTSERPKAHRAKNPSGYWKTMAALSFIAMTFAVSAGFSAYSLFGTSN